MFKKYICLHMKTHIKDYLLDFFSYHSWNNCAIVII
jgi:hypothetical protein